MESTTEPGSHDGTRPSGQPPDTPATSQLSESHRQHLLSELGGEAAVKAAIRYGARSIDADEAHAMGFRYKGWRGGGLLLPFGDKFAQLRLDDPPTGRDGKPVKYLNLKGVKQQPATFGEGEPTQATEGWKDGLRLHLETREPVQAIAGVTGHKQLAPSVKVLLYDADASANPHVCRPLLRAGTERKGLRLGFFDRTIAGPGGGACEFFNGGGDFNSLRLYKPLELLTALPDLWPKQIRPDWIDLALSCAVTAGLDLSLSGQAMEGLLRPVCRRLGVGIDSGRAALGREQARRDRKALIEEHGFAGYQRLVAEQAEQCPEEPTRRELQRFLEKEYKLRFDELQGVAEIDGERLEDIDLADSLLADKHGIEVTKQIAKDSLMYVALKGRYNPVREYLQGLSKRKGKMRLVTIREIAAAFGVEPGDTDSEEMLARHLIGCYRRGMDPGCKHDQVVILVGKQGAMKGQTIKALVPQEAWYDSATRVSSKGFEDREVLGKLNSSWIFEFDETDKVLLGRDSSEFKGFATREVDSYIQKWETVCKGHPRRFCLFGTTNHHEILNDPTGDRRFWIVPVGQCDPEWVRANRDSLWATVATWAAWGGLSWVPEGHPLALKASERAKASRISEPWTQPVAQRLEQIKLFDGDQLDQRALGEGISQLALIRQALAVNDVTRITRDVQMTVTRIVTGAGFTTHGGRIRWVQQKRRFQDAMGVAGPPCSGYMPVPVLQPVPTEAAGGRHGETPWHDSDLETLFQPFQPKTDSPHKGKTGDSGGGGGGDYSSTSQGDCSKRVATVGTPPRSTAPQEVRRANGVGTRSAQDGTGQHKVGTTPPIGAPVELLDTETGTWLGGWRVTGEPEGGPGGELVQITSADGLATRLVPPDQIRPCVGADPWGVAA